MTYDKHELKFLTIAGGLAAPGQPVKLHWLNLFYDRPGEIQKLVDRLRAHGYITFDPYQHELRVLWKPVLQVLLRRNQTGELFTGEQPLDAVLAESQRVDRMRAGTFRAEAARPPGADLSFNANSCEITRPAPEEKAPPPAAATRGIPAVAHVFHAAMPMPMPSMPMPESRTTHVHGPCNSGKALQLHEHGHGNQVSGVRCQVAAKTGHEVGELSRRTTAEILAEILEFAPKLSAEHREHWQQRIECEDAELVNAIVRQVRLQHRGIRNIAAWMNAAYLNGIRKKENAVTKVAGKTL